MLIYSLSRKWIEWYGQHAHCKFKG